jgi:uncharacterized protein (TIGR02996 family)
MTTTSISPSLAKAEQAVRAGDLGTALALLLSVWRQVRAPELGDAIERLSALAAASRPPVRGATQTAFDEHWRARASEADAVELGVLLPSLLRGDSYQARRRLRLLARHAPDPRLASTLAAAVRHPPYVSGSTSSFWRTLHAVLVECADPRVLDALEPDGSASGERTSMTERLEGWRRRSRATMQQRVAELPCALDPEQRERLAVLEALIGERELSQARRSGDELLAEVYAEPSDLVRRQIYADFLLERGDPRGELIALQLADARGQLDRAGRTRIRALLREHQLAWLGPLAPVLVRAGAELRNGFLTRARIRQGARGLAGLREEPSWATVETLEYAPPEFVDAPALRALRSLRWTESQVLAAAELGPQLPDIVELVSETRERERYYDRAPLTLALPPVFEDPRWLPGLRRVELITELEPLALAWLWTGPLGRRLERATVSSTRRGELDLLAVLRSLRSASEGPAGTSLSELRIAGPVLECWFVHGPEGWTHALLEAGPEFVEDQAAPVFHQLAEHGEVTIELGPALNAKLDRG